MKAQSLWALRRVDKVLSVCEEIDRRFAGNPDPMLRREVALALLFKSLALERCHRTGEAAAAMGTVVARYGKDADQVLQDLSALARSGNTDVLSQIGAGGEINLLPAGS